MAKKKDLLRDKLNALNPSIPTNTRGEAARETRFVESAADLKSRPRRKKAPKAKVPAVKRSAPPRPSPEIEARPATAPQEAPHPSPRNENPNPFADPFLFSALMQENLVALNRMREAMVSINSLFFDSCRRYAGLCFENLTKGCFCYPRLPAGKWPFMF